MEEITDTPKPKKDPSAHFLDKWIEYIWIRPALLGRHVSYGMPLTLTDGIFLATWPRVGVMAPMAALVIGLLFGWMGWGYDVIYSESILFLCIAVAFGILSAFLGWLFLFGFFIGEFILATDWISSQFSRNVGFMDNVLHYRIPLLITYGLLATLVIKIPVMTKQLLVQIRPPQGVSDQVKTGMMMMFHTLVTGILVYFWIQIMPVLLRPIFTWSGRSPSVSAIEMFQKYGYLLMILAIIASLFRMYLQSLTAFQKPYRDRLERIEAYADQIYQNKEAVTPLVDRFNPWVRSAFVSVILTLALAGLYESWLDAIILGSFIFYVQMATRRLIPVPLGRWPYWMERIPLLYRLIGGFMLIWYISRSVLEHYFSVWQDSFRPIIMVTGLAILIIFLLNPGLPKDKIDPSEDEEQGGEKTT